MIVRALGMPEAKGEVPAFRMSAQATGIPPSLHKLGSMSFFRGMRTAVSGRLKASRAKRRWRSWVESWSWQD